MKTKNKRGAILITTVILSIGITVAIGSFIALSVQTARLSNSSFNFNSAMNLAEAGIEEAIWSINNNDWTGWGAYQGNAANRVKKISGYDLGTDNTGETQVVVFGAAWASNPRVVAQGATLGNLGRAVTKQIDVRLRRRSLYATGIVAKDQIVFSGGNVEIDSYNSSDEAYSDGGLYDPTEHRDHGTVASVSVEADIVNISNGDVWGYVATGGSDPKTGPNGTIKGEDSPSGVNIDPNRVATDFTANFEPVEEPKPTLSLGSLTATTTITGPKNVALDYNNPATYVLYQVSSINISSSETLVIDGNVVLLVTGNADIKGGLVITKPATTTEYAGLLMFARGDVTVGGNGLVNGTGIPENLEIRGSNTTLGGQQIKLNGNASMQAAVYAPNANVVLDGGGGGGEWMGSVIGASVKITGNYKFHYDEALADKQDGNPFGVALWRELIGSEQIPF